MVAIRTVVPDLMRSPAGARAEMYPQTTVSGVEPRVTSGLFPAGAGCAAAAAPKTKTLNMAHHGISDLATCLDIEFVSPAIAAAPSASNDGFEAESCAQKRRGSRAKSCQRQQGSRCRFQF